MNQQSNKSISKRIFFFLLLSLALLLTGCDPAPTPLDIEGETIQSFSYNYGGYPGGMWEYQITPQDDRLIFQGKGYNGIPLDIESYIEPSVLEDLQGILTANHMGDWNGFHQRNDQVMDGDGFSLEVTYHNGTTLSASGHMLYPENYKTASIALQAYLDDLSTQQTLKEQRTQDFGAVTLFQFSYEKEFYQLYYEENTLWFHRGKERVPVPPETMEALKKIITTYNLNNWEPYYRDRNKPDSKTEFQTAICYTDTPRCFQSSGTNTGPPNFPEAASELTQFFDSLTTQYLPHEELL